MRSPNYRPRLAVQFICADMFGLRTHQANKIMEHNEDDYRKLVRALLKGVTKKDFERDVEIINELFTDPNKKIPREWELYIEVAMELGLID